MRATEKSTFEQDVLKSTKIVLLDVWEPWCAPCRGMEPVIEAISQETKSWAEVIKLDASIEMDLVQELGVSALPTFLIYKNGQIVGSTIGAVAKNTVLNLMEKAK